MRTSSFSNSKWYILFKTNKKNFIHCFQVCRLSIFAGKTFTLYVFSWKKGPGLMYFLSAVVSRQHEGNFMKLW